MAVLDQSALMRLKITAAPTMVTLSGTTARSTELSAGLWDITSSADAFVLQGNSGVNATTSSVPLWAKEWRAVHIEDEDGNGTDTFIAGITTGGAATLYCVRRTSSS